MITIFENFRKPDLRELGEFVRCIKSYNHAFIENNVYKIVKAFGDPQRAIEEFGINNYVPIECVSIVHIKDDYDIVHKFAVNYERYKNWHKSHFFDYFELMEESTIAKKYNL
jgi:hypothetical protein